MLTSQEKTFVEAICEAHHIAMAKDPKTLCFGLGVDDPKRIFGSTQKLQETFGPERVFDMPTSENAMTGVAIGAAIRGFRPIMVHQRFDFFLLAMDQLVNNAAKWRFMFGGQDSVPLTIRLIVGRGWGQGPTHSQSYHSWFTHIPGLKVVMPSTPKDAKNLLLASIFDDNPVLFIEHRWLHQQTGVLDSGTEIEALGKSKVLKKGDDITIVGLSLMSIEALRAANILKQNDVSAEVVDLRTIKPMDLDPVYESVIKTGHLLVLDIGPEVCSVASEIIAKVTEKCFKYLKSPPRKIALPDMPVPTSFGLTKGFYPTSDDIVSISQKMLGKNFYWNRTDQANDLHDVPGEWFKGPF